MDRGENAGPRWNAGILPACVPRVERRHPAVVCGACRRVDAMERRHPAGV